MSLTENQKPLLAGAFLFLVSFVVYIPAMRAGFVWDDDVFLWNNPLIHAADGLHSFWFTTLPGDYFPLTSSMLWIEWRLFGIENPSGYHFINILLHATSSVLLWRVLQRLAIPGAWLAALFFAVHPVNVEAVAWITQRKSTLPMVFALLSTLFFFRWSDSRRPPFRAPHFWLSLACFLLALLAKTSVVMLPAAFLALTWWRSGSLTRRDVVATVPFFLVAGALALATIWFQYNRAIGDVIVRDDDLLSRTAIAGRAIWFYLSKALLPLNLNFVYPRWTADTANLSVYLPLLLVFAAAAALWMRRDRPWARASLAAAAVYVLMLLPMLGFFNIYFMRFSLVADHYQYAALPAIIAPLMALLTLAANRWRKPGLVYAAVAVGVSLFAVLTWRQADLYRNEETLWQATLAKNPRSWMAHHNLGLYLSKLGRPDAAADSFRKSIALYPEHAMAHTNLASVLRETGQLDEALIHYRKAVEIEPQWAVAHYNLGNALVKPSQDDEAIARFQRAVEINPEFVLAHNNLGNALRRQGRLPEAIAAYQRALAIQPDFTLARKNLDAALQKQESEGNARSGKTPMAPPSSAKGGDF